MIKLTEKYFRKIIKEELRETVKIYGVPTDPTDIIMTEEFVSKIANFLRSFESDESIHDLALALSYSANPDYFLDLKSSDKEKIARLLGMKQNTLDLYATFSSSVATGQRSSPWQAKIAPKMKMTAQKLLADDKQQLGEGK